MPLATSTAMINLDCRSRVLYFEKKKKLLKVNKQTKIICKLFLSVNHGTFKIVLNSKKLYTLCNVNVYNVK